MDLDALRGAYELALVHLSGAVSPNAAARAGDGCLYCHLNTYGGGRHMGGPRAAGLVLDGYVEWAPYCKTCTSVSLRRPRNPRAQALASALRQAHAARLAYTTALCKAQLK